MTLEEDLSKMKEYRDRYLNRDKGDQSVFRRLSRCVISFEVLPVFVSSLCDTAARDITTGVYHVQLDT